MVQFSMSFFAREEDRTKFINEEILGKYKMEGIGENIYFGYYVIYSRKEE